MPFLKYSIGGLNTILGYSGVLLGWTQPVGHFLWLDPLFAGGYPAGWVPTMRVLAARVWGHLGSLFGHCADLGVHINTSFGV